MKYIVEYKLHGGQVPYFIFDGGYFAKDEKIIGITFDWEKCFMPDLQSYGGKLRDFSRESLTEHLENLGLENVQECVEFIFNKLEGYNNVI